MQYKLAEIRFINLLYLNEKIGKVWWNENLPVGDDFELFENEEDSAFDEKLFVLVQRRVQHQQVTVFHSLNDFRELHQVVPGNNNSPEFNILFWL